MSVSTLSPAPDTQHHVSGAGVPAEPPTTTSSAVLDAVFNPVDLDSLRRHADNRRRSWSTTATAAQRGAHGTPGDYATWLRHTASANGCSRPVRLSGTVLEVDTRTGAVVSTMDTSGMPDGVIYTACGNRRANVCPACAETYRADTYHLIMAGLVGGKNVPTTVTRHPCVFLTLTAPSFGVVHTRRIAGGHGSGGKVLPCRPARRPKLCPHGVDLRCSSTHRDDDSRLGRPLCLDCYDHLGQAVFNHAAPELWRRTTVAFDRLLQRAAKQCAGPDARVRLSFAKVAEFQRRGVVHFHALIRLDGHDPAAPADVVEPPAGMTPAVLEAAVLEAVASTSYRTDPHPLEAHGWPIAWGVQVDARTVRAPGDRQITEGAVAGYLAKYATKATETTGHLSARITNDTLDLHADPTTHTGRQIAACWQLGDSAGTLAPGLDAALAWKTGYGRLRRWAHMLGFGGHFTTKSRRYSTTYGAERARRADWRRQQARPRIDNVDQLVRAVDHIEEETTLVVGALTYAGAGWRTPGDALLATTAAAMAREHRRTAREQTAAQIAA